ncbi:alpha/beta fold hydrolase [soil metagenome]
MALAEISGHRIHYLDQGAGEPALVLLHAFPLRAAMWSPQLDALSAATRVVAPDLLGFGATDAPDDPSAYSVDIWADQVAGLLDHLGHRRIILGGLSMGGYAAFAFARRHRSRLAGLVLADTRPGPDTPEAAERRQDQIGQLRERGSAELVEILLGGLLGEHTRRHRPDVVAATRSLMDSSPAGFIGALEAMIRRPDSTPELADINVPTLVLVGADDTLSPPEVARSMHAAIPGAALAVLPDAGHLSNLEVPAAFSDALADFVGRCQEARKQS